MKNVFKILTPILLLAVMAAGVFLVKRNQDTRRGASASDAAVSIYPSKLEGLGVGQTFAVSVFVNTGKETDLLAGAEIKLEYDPTVLEWVGSVAASADMSVVNDTQTSVLDANHIDRFCSVVSLGDDKGGANKIMIVTFKVKALGSGTIEVKNANLMIDGQSATWAVANFTNATWTTSATATATIALTPTDVQTTAPTCVWCGSSCAKNNPAADCAGYAPPTGVTCVDVAGVCTKKCVCAGGAACPQGNVGLCPEALPTAIPTGIHCPAPVVGKPDQMCLAAVMMVKDPKTGECCAYRDSCSVPSGMLQGAAAGNCSNIICKCSSGANCPQNDVGLCPENIPTISVIDANRTNFTIGYSGIFSPTSTDWIGIYPAGTTTVDTAYKYWVYTNSIGSCTEKAGDAKSSGSCVLVLPDSVLDGTYELRLFSKNGYTKLTTSASFVISSSLSPTVVPTAIPTVIPTTIPTVVPTETIVPDGVSGVLKFKMSFAGVTAAAKCASNWAMQITVRVGDTTTVVYEDVPLTISGTQNGLLVYTGELLLKGLKAKTNLALFMKGPRHIQTKYGVDGQSDFYNKAGGEIAVDADPAKTPVLDFTKYPMMAGDVTGLDGSSDGVVNGLDFAYVKNEVIKRTDGENMLADLNGNCKLESQDLSLLMQTLKDKAEQLY